MSKKPLRKHQNYEVASIATSYLTAVIGMLAAPIAYPAIPLGEGCIGKLLPLSEGRAKPVIMFACLISNGTTRFWCESDLGTSRHGEVSDPELCLQKKAISSSESSNARDISVGYPNGAHYMGHGSYGVPNGKGTWTWNSPGGDKIEQTGYWVNGRRAGEFTIYRNGQIEEISQFVEDKRNGPSTSYAKGVPVMSGLYDNDLRVGDWTVVDGQNSQPIAVWTYSAGSVISKRGLPNGGSAKGSP